MKNLLFCLTLLSFGLDIQAQTTVKKVVLQGFWWDYRNSNYIGRWSNYLVELAPRLKEMGIDAVWIPPFVKNQGINYVGYSPFDQYDLGDKWQKDNLKTPLGNKDELLRLIAVLHANGIEVIQDVVLNHVNGAGSSTSEGGVDPATLSMATSAGYKNFRYACWETPNSANTAANYWGRKGRWYKNYTNFYPNPDNNCTTGDICDAFFGPDISYDEGAFGPSTNVVGYNPAQSTNWMRNNARDWMMWCKKQTDVDGYRWDAVKHFPTAVQEDLSWNVKYGVPSWTQGGENMFNVGEWVGSKDALDAYVTTIAAPTGEKMMGTFDFGLRAFDGAGGLYGIVSGNGGFDMGSLPGAQQTQRVHYYPTSNKYVHRTVTFVNNHDTFRPQLGATGNYTGWNTGSELSAHIEPNNTRMPVAYAVVMAMDGNPQIFFEDLFDIGYNGNRYSHDPKSITELPIRADLVNLVWCHQNLGFKDGAYIVPYQSADYLVIERAGKAVIGMTDNYSNWQNANVTTAFAQGTVLRDYSGATAATVTVGAGGVVNISTPPCNPALNPASRHGYSVWAPDGQLNDNYAPPRAKTTTQEWEMADDLGDKHPNSLTQGGALPANATNQRVAGKIFVAQGKIVTFVLYPAVATQHNRIGLYNLDGELLAEQDGSGTLTGTWTPDYTGWVAIKVRKNSATGIKQKCWVNVTYTAPATVTDAQGQPSDNLVSIWTGNGDNTNWTDPYNWEEGLVPNINSMVIITGYNFPMPVVTTNPTIGCLLIEEGGVLTVEGNLTVNCVVTNNGTIQGNGTVGNEDIAQNNLQFSAVPNPSDSNIHIEAIGLWQPNTPLQVSVSDTSGRTVLTFNGTLDEINQSLVATFPNLAAGQYYLRIVCETYTGGLKVMRL